VKVTIDTTAAELADALDRLRSGPATADIGPLAGEQCRRALCGHPRANHDDKDFYGQAMGVGKGACRICISATKCERFVGAGGS
jgi:hypothetical protein